MKRLSLLVLLSLIAARDAQATRRFALVVGTNRADESGTLPLRYADDDAIAIHQLLLEAGVVSRLLTVPDRDTSPLHPDLSVPPPTQRELVRAFEELLALMKAERDPVELLFFYSGHGGVAHGEGYVVLEGGERLFRSALHREILARSPARLNHVIVDACKSYFMAFAKGPGGQRELHGRLLRDDEVPPHTGFILSTSSGRDSHEWDRYQSGVFSHQVRSALRGGADANRDATISYAELGAFLDRANASIVNPKFRPEFAVRPPGAHPGDLEQAVLAWSQPADSVTLGASAVRRAYLEGPNGERILDVHARDLEVVRLFVPAVRPLFLREIDETKEWVIGERGQMDLASLSPSLVAVTAKGARHLAFERLFDVPFGSSDVASYAAAYAAGPDPLVVEHEKVQEDGLSWVKPAVGYGSIVLAVAGLALSGWALERRYSSDSLPFDAQADRDHQIHQLNAGAVSLYVAAALAGGTWLLLTLWPAGDQGGTEVSLGFGSRF